MLNINKQLLFARLDYLNEIKSSYDSESLQQQITGKIRELVENEEITTYMALESVYNYLTEKMVQDVSQADHYAKEIISFIN